MATKNAHADVVDTNKRVSGYKLNSDGGLVTWGRCKEKEGSERVLDFRVVLPYHATVQSDAFHMYAYASGARVAVQKFIRSLMPKFTNDEITEQLSKLALDTLVPDGARADVDPLTKATNAVNKLTPEQKAELLALLQG